MRLLTLAQFAEMLSIKLSTARSWVWLRKIPYVKLGRAVRIRQDVAEELVNRGSVPPVSVRDLGDREGANTAESSNPNRPG